MNPDAKVSDIEAETAKVAANPEQYVLDMLRPAPPAPLAPPADPDTSSQQEAPAPLAGPASPEQIARLGDIIGRQIYNKFRGDGKTKGPLADLYSSFTDEEQAQLKELVELKRTPPKEMTLEKLDECLRNIAALLARRHEILTSNNLKDEMTQFTIEDLRAAFGITVRAQ